MSALTKNKKYKPEEYLILEREAEEKSEYYNEKIIKRASSNIDHVRIMGNISADLSSIIKSKKVQVFGCGLKVRTIDRNYFFYPDILVLREIPIFHDKEKDVILNPAIVFEIVSNESEFFDRSDKFIAYQQIESIKEIIFVDQYKPIVERFFRLDNKTWNYRATFGLENSLKFESVKAKLKLEKIYRKVKVNQNIYERKHTY